MDQQLEKEKWFSLLVRSHESKLIRYASKLVVLSLAKEIVQESFLKAWVEKYPSLVGREAPWLFAVTRNLCLDVKKKESKRDYHYEIEEKLDSNQESSHEKMERKENENHVLKSIEKLTSVQQEVLRLKFQEGFSYKEISQITGHTVSYVGVLIHEGVTHLRMNLSSQRGSK